MVKSLRIAWLTYMLVASGDDDPNAFSGCPFARGVKNSQPRPLETVLSISITLRVPSTLKFDVGNSYLGGFMLSILGWT